MKSRVSRSISLFAQSPFEFFGYHFTELFDSEPLDRVLDARAHQVLSLFVLPVKNPQRGFGVTEEVLYRHKFAQRLRHLRHDR